MKKSGSLLCLCAALLLTLAGCAAPQAAPAPTGTNATPPTAPAGAGLSSEQVATLSSLEQVDDYPLYSMHYQGAYAGRDNRAGSPESSISMSGLPGWGCSLFAALADENQRIYGRNFDWEFSPALLLFTDPPDGYASVSLVDITYLGFEGDVMALPLVERKGLLDAPDLPFDGMNEHGLAVGMAAVPPGGMQDDPDKVNVGSLKIIRLMLDRARTVEEAVAVMEEYDIDFAGGPPIHYLMADASGRAALVEYYQGERVVTYNDQPWHQATNFLLAGVESSPEGQCWRYDLISQSMAETGGRLETGQGLELLSSVAQENTQWSVVYNLSSGEVRVALGRDYHDVYTFQQAP